MRRDSGEKATALLERSGMHSEVFYDQPNKCTQNVYQHYPPKLLTVILKHFSNFWLFIRPPSFMLTKIGI